MEQTIRFIAADRRRNWF